ncbi:MAG: hypothetical protein AB2417_14665 [Clostridiaceae bacterium]
MKNNNKGIIIFLIIIIALSVNYSIYKYIFVPKFSNLKSVEKEYNDKEKELEELVKIKENIHSARKENEVLKGQVKELDKLILKEINTQKLAYDFYKSCKDFNITGEEIKFSIEGSDKKEEEGSEKDRESNSSVNNDEKENSEDIIRLEIYLKISGKKIYIEKYINNLNKITEGKLNVKSINLSTDKTDNAEEEVTVTNEDYLQGEIEFYQYLKLNDEEKKNIKKYDFYHNKVGFDSISNMFGN